MTLSTKRFLIFPLILLLVLIQGCSSDAEPDDAEIIEDDPVEIRIEILDENIMIEASTEIRFDLKGVKDESKIKCESSDSKIVKIVGAIVYGLSSGKANIDCIYDGVESNTVSINIEAPVVEEPVEEPVEENISVISLTSPIKAGSNATLKIKGLPNTEFSISVYYSSGESEASGLQDKTSDSDGKVSWTWKVGSRTKPGEYHIEVYSADESLIIPFTVK